MVFLEQTFQKSQELSQLRTFDAITSDRPYRKSHSWEFAIKEIKENAGKQFDPEIAAVFVKFITEEWLLNQPDSHPIET
jgi:HD-GYP domain-containing protein (c-di-GMP phosphodiesterase class II)